MRHILYKVQLNMENGDSHIISIATPYKEKLPELIDKNKVWFERDAKVVGWKFLSEAFTRDMAIEKYEEEVSFCDIVDEVE